jgi:hypothetical protein
VFYYLILQFELEKVKLKQNKVKTSTPKKILKNWFGIAVLLSSLLIFNSCKSDSDEQGTQYSENGIKLCQNAQKLIQDMSSSLSNQDYQSEFIKIMNNPSPETYVMQKDSNNSELKMQYLYLLNAFKSLEKTFNTFQLQLSNKISVSSSNLEEKLLMTCNGLDSLTLSEELANKNVKLKKNVKSGKFRVEGTVYQITDMYAEVWDEYSGNYLSSQIKAQQKYENGIKNISVSAFNSEKIKTLVNEPYSNDAVLINLYKLKLIKDNQEKLTAIESRIKNISDSYQILLRIQGELIKNKKNKVKIQELNNSIQALLANQ